MKALDPNERKELWNKIDEASRKLGVMTLPKLHVGMKVEKDGVTLLNQREEGHSWTRNYWVSAFYYLAGAGATGSSFGAGYLASKRTSGAVDAYAAVLPIPLGPIGKSTDSNGIIVGTDDTAFSVEQYTVIAPILHGNVEGRLAYAAESAITAAYNEGTKTWTVTRSRIMNNNSGGSITVKEVGMQSNWGGGYKYLMERSVLASPVAVANGAQLTVTYEISMDFSSIDT